MNIPIRPLFFLLCLLALRTSTDAQILIASWTFEITTPADLNNATTYPAFNADIGSGTASGFHASNATDWSTPGGNGSANSLSTNTWSVGDYLQFQVSTLGLQSIALSWAQTSSSSGPGSFKLSYSTDGATFVDFGSAFTVLTNSGVNTWSNGTAIPATMFSRDLSSLATIGNDASIYFRLTDAATTSAGGGTVTASGSSRLDDFSVTGFSIPPPSASLTSVPEPASYGLLGSITLLAAVALQRRRQS